MIGLLVAYWLSRADENVFSNSNFRKLLGCVHQFLKRLGIVSSPQELSLRLDSENAEVGGKNLDQRTMKHHFG